MIRLLKFLFLGYFLTINAFAQLSFTKKEYQYIKKNNVKVAMLPDFPPFSSYEEDKLSGYSYDILKLISKKSGLKFEYQIDSWPINLKKFKEKKIDIIDAISFREKRLKYTNFIDPYYEVPLVIFSRKELTSYSDINSLKGKKLGITKNIFYKKQVEDLGIFDIVEYESFEKKLKALAFGEIDVIFGHLLSTQIAIHKSQYTNMKVLDELKLPNLKKTDLRFGIDKDNVILSSIFNKAFKNISIEEWRELHKKWISIYTNKSQLSENNNKVVLTSDERRFLSKNKIDCVVIANWTPLNFYSNNEIFGISNDFWNLIKERTSINSECRVVGTFENILNQIKDKKADLTLSTAITEDRKKYANFSVPYVSFPIAIATTLDKVYLSETSSLNGKKVAVGKSYSAFYILKEKYPKINFVQVKNNLEAFRLLSKGDVFAVIDILPVLSQMIGDYGFKNLKISGTTEFNFDVRIMVRKDYGELIPIINKGINAISKKEIQGIKDRWLSAKIENNIDYSKFWQIGLVLTLILSVLFYRQFILNRHNRRLQDANDEIEIKKIELQKKTKQLAKQKELFEKIYYESSDGIFLVNMYNMEIMDSNDVSFKLLSYENKEIFLNLKYGDFFPKKQPDGSDSLMIAKNMVSVAIEKGHVTFELLHKKADDSNIWLEVVLTFITIDDEDIIHVVWRDIEKRKDMEKKLNILTHNLEDQVKEEVKKNEEKTKQLIQQNRLAQMGEMISMIAHQWRQPLTAISATTNNLALKMMLDKKIEKIELQNEINLISDYAQYLSLTIDDFRNFFKTDKEKVNIKLETIIDNSISIVKSSLDAYFITLTTDFKCNETVNIYSTELNQVILNLIKNAQDAFVETNINHAEIKINTYSENLNAIIEISDNAGGIPEHILDKIFDPYFSTKKSKDGTGLGLYMSKIIVNEHCGGVLSVSNGKLGARFRIEIPFE